MSLATLSVHTPPVTVLSIPLELCGAMQRLQGHLDHKKVPPPPWTTVGPWAKSHCMVLGESSFLWAMDPCSLAQIQFGQTGALAGESEHPFFFFFITLKPRVE